MVSVPIDTIRDTLTRALARREITGEAAELLIEDYLGAEIDGKVTHGLARFLIIDSDLATRGGPPRVVRETASTALVDGNQELGVLAAAFCADKAMELARQTGVGVVGMVNASRYGRLVPYGERLARSGFVGIVLNNAGPPNVVPEGGIDRVLGTNPICFAFPTRSEPLVIDFSTAEKVWRVVRQAELEQRPLPPDVFMDTDGQFTTDAASAVSVLSFGGAKGYALCLAIEILGGALVGAKMGPLAKSQYELGFLMLAIAPAAFGTAESLGPEVETLLETIRGSRPRSQDAPIRVPGDRSRAHRQAATAAGTLDVYEGTWERLQQMC